MHDIKRLENRLNYPYQYIYNYLKDNMLQFFLLGNSLITESAFASPRSAADDHLSNNTT